MWLVITVVQSECFRLVTERRLYNACPIYANCSSVRPVLFFHRRVWYHVLSLRYARIQRLGIILTPKLPLCQILFLSLPPITALACEEKSDTQSISHSPSFFDMPGTEAFVLELRVRSSQSAEIYRNQQNVPAYDSTILSSNNNYHRDVLFTPTTSCNQTQTADEVYNFYHRSRCCPVWHELKP